MVQEFVRSGLKRPRHDTPDYTFEVFRAKQETTWCIPAKIRPVLVGTMKPCPPYDNAGALYCRVGTSFCAHRMWQPALSDLHQVIY
jgi:hypothetical protein